MENFLLSKQPDGVGEKQGTEKIVYLCFKKENSSQERIKEKEKKKRSRKEIRKARISRG
jgi:hypothetical protein